MSLIITDTYEAAQFLHREQVIGMPTETVYGLAGNIYSQKAVTTIFRIKGRPFHNPLIVHIKSLACLSKVAVAIPEMAIQLANKFWPGPLTLVLQKHPSVPGLVTAGKSTIAVRIPAHPVALSLLEKISFPLAAPSANPFGSISPTTAEHVARYFPGTLPIILEGGPCEKGIESTIIGFTKGKATLYRHGSISLEKIESISGKLKMAINNEKDPDAPGMLSKHYAPVTSLFLTDDIEKSIKQYAHHKIGLLLFDRNMPDLQNIYQHVLSTSGDLQEAAANLYASLHTMDTLGLDIIIAERLPERGIGRSINDRLTRASNK